VTKRQRERRSKGEGTIRLRADGRYECREPPKTVPPGEKQRSVYGRSEREVIRKLRELRRDREQGLNFDAARLTVGEYLERWIEGPLKGSVAKKTHDDYAHMARRHLIPALGRLKLHKLTAEHLDELYAKKLADGLSARTVTYIHSTIRVALQRAVKKRLVPYNVARDADPPPTGDEAEEKTVLTMGQLSNFFKAAAETEDRFEALFVVGALAGPRPQELLGHKWQDLTLPEEAGKPGAMEIRRRVSSSSAGLEILDGTKGSRGKKKSRRAVYLMPEAVAALKVHRLRYLEERVKRADRWEATWQKRPEARDLVFPSTVGGPMSRNNLARRYFKPLAERARLPEDATLYTLRHTLATLWLESKEPVKVLQEILGHSRIDVTMNVYAHVLPHIQEDAMGRFAQRLRGAGSTPTGP
jgi:integrase